MADKTFQVRSLEDQAFYDIKLTDNGDDTYSFTGDVDVTSLAGDYTTPTHSAVTVTSTTTQALAANANRKYVLLVNDSDTAIYIKLGAAAVANEGIRLNANGGSYEMSNLGGNLYAGAINAIHGGSGNKTLLVTEGV